MVLRAIVEWRAKIGTVGLKAAVIYHHNSETLRTNMREVALRQLALYKQRGPLGSSFHLMRLNMVNDTRRHKEKQLRQQRGLRSLHHVLRAAYSGQCAVAIWWWRENASEGAPTQFGFSSEESSMSLRMQMQVRSSRMLIKLLLESCGLQFLPLRYCFRAMADNHALAKHGGLMEKVRNSKAALAEHESQMEKVRNINAALAEHESLMEKIRNSKAAAGSQDEDSDDEDSDDDQQLVLSTPRVFVHPVMPQPDIENIETIQGENRGGCCSGAHPAEGVGMSAGDCAIS